MFVDETSGLESESRLHAPKTHSRTSELQCNLRIHIEESPKLISWRIAVLILMQNFAHLHCRVARLTV